MAEVFDPSGVTDSEKRALQDEISELRDLVEQLRGDTVVRPEQFQGEAPRYRLNDNCFLEDDTLHTEGEEIEYLGIPNMSMVPLNEPARAKMQDLINALTEGARRKAAKEGREFMGFNTDMGTAIATAMQDARRQADRVEIVQTIQMPEAKGETTPAMPHTPEAQSLARRRGRPPKSRAVLSSKPSAPPEKPGPKGPAVLGNRYERASGEAS